MGDFMGAIGVVNVFKSRGLLLLFLKLVDDIFHGLVCDGRHLFSF